LDESGVATGEFACDSRYEGYTGVLHGGIISALLDGAMTNCLFLHGQVAVTAELVVRFRHPILLERSAEVQAWITVAEPPVFRLKAQIEQDGIVKAAARAAFMMPSPRSQRITEAQR
jgi:acyl-coenzyme A thioesterase PaaI-like protein